MVTQRLLFIGYICITDYSIVVHFSHRWSACSRQETKRERASGATDQRTSGRAQETEERSDHSGWRGRKSCKDGCCHGRWVWWCAGHNRLIFIIGACLESYLTSSMQKLPGWLITIRSRQNYNYNRHIHVWQTSLDYCTCFRCDCHNDWNNCLITVILRKKEWYTYSFIL